MANTLHTLSSVPGPVGAGVAWALPRWTEIASLTAYCLSSDRLTHRHRGRSVPPV